MNKYLKNIVICTAAIIIQLYFPPIYISDNAMAPDFLLIVLTYLAIGGNKKFLLICGFATGLMQDMITQSTLIGVFSFSKTLSAFALSYIYDYRKIWSNEIKYIFLFAIYLVHFFVSYYFTINRFIDYWNIIFYYSIIQTLITFLIFYVINRVIFIDKKVVR